MRLLRFGVLTPEAYGESIKTCSGEAITLFCLNSPTFEGRSLAIDAFDWGDHFGQASYNPYENPRSGKNAAHGRHSSGILEASSMPFPRLDDEGCDNLCRGDRFGRSLPINASTKHGNCEALLGAKGKLGR